MEVRGRANTGNSLNGGEPHGLERVIESLKVENAEFRKTLRELDDRCMSLAPCYWWDRCKLAEYDQLKEEIQVLKAENVLLRRRASTGGSQPGSASLPSAANSLILAEGGAPSTMATWGSPDTKKSETTEEKNTTETTDPQDTPQPSEGQNVEQESETEQMQRSKP